jgi:NADH dehydrogenase
MQQRTQTGGTIRTVAVTGATGFVGRSIVSELFRAGYNVRGLIRDVEKSRAVLPAVPKGLDLDLVVGEASDPRSAAELLRDSQACINAVGILREVRRLGVTFRKAHVDTTRVLAQTCESAGVARFVQISAMGVTETSLSEYQKTKFEAEAILRKSTLDWTVLRPSLIHGKDGEFVQQVAAWAKGRKAPFVFLPYFTGGEPDTRVPLGGTNPVDPRIAPVAVEEVARAAVTALSTPASIGEIYNLAGPRVMTWPQMLTFMRENIPGSFKLPAFGVPSEPAAILAKVASFVGLGAFLPFDEGMARMGAEDAAADIAKARADLAFAPRDFKKLFPRYAGAIEVAG